MSAALLESLAAIARADRYARKLLVCRTRGEAREILRALAVSGEACIGFEATTIRDIAATLAARALTASGLQPADEFTALALLEDAVDEALAGAGERGGALRLIAEGTGFRDAVRRTIDTLRLEGASPATLRNAGMANAARAEALAAMLNGYAHRLFDARLADSTTVYLAAHAALGAGSAHVPDARILLAPGLDMRGVRGELVRLLIERGAELLPHDAVSAVAPRTLLWQADRTAAAPGAERDDAVVDGAERPPPRMFAAASVTDELREVLRRVLDAGARWDEVEIIASDPVVYGCALDALATRLTIPVTYAVGLPLDRTRVGRALTGYLQWIREDFRADLLRNLFQSGCLEAPHAPGISPMSLAHRLRELRIGWDRARYMPAITRALESLEQRAVLHTEDEEADARSVELERARVELTVLGEVVGEILAATPDIGGRAREDAVVSVADLAAGLLALLRFVPIRNKLEESACNSLRAQLERAARSLTRRTSARVALATLHERLNIRVPAVSAEEPPPWGSAGGHLHLSDVEHGGWTARRYTFVVGLDSGRFPGAITQDPLLTDEDRRRVNATGAMSLATSADRIGERRFLIEALLARLHRSVTLSYAAWDASEARKSAPAAILLQVFRASTGNARAGYEELHEALGAPISAVPRSGGRVDATDVWLGALEHGGVLRAGTSVVLQAFPALNQGLLARDSHYSDELNRYSGRIEPRPLLLDPRANNGIRVSARRLEALGACPLRYLFAYVLDVKKPQDPELTPDAWLNPVARGNLLHSVYEIALRTARQLAMTTSDDAFEQLCCDVLDAEARKLRDTLPAPSDGVYARDVQELRADVHVFVEIARRHPDWLQLEVSFGFGAKSVRMDVRGGAINLQGKIDRIDAENGQLVVIDYKSGGKFGRWNTPFNGARRLQHVLYARAAEQLLGPRVARIDYLFPTVKGRDESESYDAHALERGPDLVADLLDLVGSGTFAPTDSAEDCKFCDFKAVCRVRQVRGSDKLETPATRLELARIRVDAIVALQQLRQRYG